MIDPSEGLQGCTGKGCGGSHLVPFGCQYCCIGCPNGRRCFVWCNKNHAHFNNVGRTVSGYSIANVHPPDASLYYFVRLPTLPVVAAQLGEGDPNPDYVSLDNVEVRYTSGAAASGAFSAATNAVDPTAISPVTCSYQDGICKLYLESVKEIGRFKKYSQPVRDVDELLVDIRRDFHTIAYINQVLTEKGIDVARKGANGHHIVDSDDERKRFIHELEKHCDQRSEFVAEQVTRVGFLLTRLHRLFNVLDSRRKEQLITRSPIPRSLLLRTISRSSSSSQDVVVSRTTRGLLVTIHLLQVLLVLLATFQSWAPPS